MKLQPFGKRIHVRPLTQDTVIRTSDNNLVERAEVLAVGDGVEKIKPGQKVLFTSYGVDSVDVNGVREYFLLEDDAFILAYEMDS